MEVLEQPPHPTQPASPETPQPKTETFPTPAHPKPRFLSKKLSIIAIILILIIFSVLGVSAFMNMQKTSQTSNSTVSTAPQPSPIPTIDPTADWKTYINTKLDYSFKYPPTLLEIDGSLYTAYPTGMPSSTAVMVINNTKKELYSKRFIDLNASVGTKKELQEKEVQTLIEKFSLDSKMAIKIKSERIGQQGGLPSGNFILIDLGDNILSIFQSDRMSQDLKKYNVTLDQILSTFQFTDQKDLITKSQTISPNGKKMIIVKNSKDSSDIHNFQRILSVTDSTGANEIELRKTVGDLIENWDDVSATNWSADSKYIYHSLGVVDGNNLYIFKSDGSKFANGENYIMLWGGIGKITWLPDSRLSIETYKPVVGGNGPTIIIDPSTETRKQININN